MEATEQAATSASVPATGGMSTTKILLSLGIAAGPLYVVVALVQMLTREGFDVTRHAVSHLSNGEYGWVQIANFLVTGLLVIAGAIGCRRAIVATRGGRWGPALLAIYGLGMLGAGVFKADPGNGFPLGVEAPAEMTNSGLLHFVFGGLGFYAIIAACFVFASRFVKTGRKLLACFSVLTGVVFFAAFAGIASGSTSLAVMIAFYLAVLWIWIWHTIVLHITKLPPPQTPAPARRSA